MNDLADLIRSRRTVHRYVAEPVSEYVLLRAVEAAIAAPNHRLTEPWRFIDVGPVTRARLFDIYRDLKASGAGELTSAQEVSLRAKFMDAAHLFVVVRRMHDDPRIAREDYAAVACAVQNLMLALHADGIGSKWTTGAVTRDPRTYEALAADPESDALEGFVWIGIAGAQAAKPSRRWNAADVLRRAP